MRILRLIANCTLLFISTTLSAQKQTFSPDGLNELNKLKSLLNTAQSVITPDDWGEDMLIGFLFDDENLDIQYRLKNADDNSDNWYITHDIPVLLIDTIYLNKKISDSTITIKAKTNNSIGSYLRSNLSAWNSDLDITLNKKVLENNFVTLFNTYINNLQKDLLTKDGFPSSARKAVEEAVFNYLWGYKYNTESISKLIADNSNFIVKCQLCEGAKSAFKKYVAAYKVTTVNPPSAFSELFTATEKEVKQKSLQDVINTAMNEYYNSAEEFYNKSEITKLQSQIVDERKKSMTIAGGKKCAICDGAVIKNTL